MTFLTWHEKIVKRISPRHLNLVITGKTLSTFALGVILSRYLVSYGYYILVASVLLLFYGFPILLEHHYSKQKTGYHVYLLTGIGFLLLMLFFGIQTTHLPFPWIFFGIGVIVALPGVWDLMRNR